MRLILGTEQLGGVDWGRYSLKECQKAFLHAIDNGVKKIDTANIYGLGIAERSISKLLGKKINRVEIITKIGLSSYKSKYDERAKVKVDLSHSALEKNIKHSLKNLNIDCIHTCLIHWPDKNKNYHKVIESLNIFKKNGYIKNFGFSNYENIIKKKDIKSLKHFQLKFNLLLNKNFKFINKISKQVDTSIYGVLAHGLLTGKYSPNHKFKKNDRRHRLKEFEKEYLRKNKKKFIFLNKISKEMNISLSNLSLALTFHLLPKTNIIIGFKNIDQIKQNIHATQLTLPNKIIKDYKKLFI